MAKVQIRLPGVLAQILGGAKQMEVQADTLQGALDQVVIDYPALKVHLYDESTQLRPHVNLFYNDTNTRWMQSLDVKLGGGDTITVMQAVSGG